MAFLNLLQIVQAACNELSLPSPATVVANTDPQVVQLLALANREGKELYDRPGPNQGWPQLRREYIFTTNAVTFANCSTNSTTTVTTGTPTGISVGMVASGNGIPYNTYVTVVGATTVTISQPATATATGVSVIFSFDNYAYPTDIAYFINKTQWDRFRRWQILGPLDPQEWQVIKSGLYPTGPRYRFRVMSNSSGVMRFWLDPPPGTNGDTIAQEYYSNAWNSNSAGTVLNTSWLADTNLPLLQDDLFVLGLKWRFLRAKGLDYEQEFDTYDRAVNRFMARSGLARDLPLNSFALGGLRLLSEDNIPDTHYGQ